jgi:hypothetical protein
MYGILHILLASTAMDRWAATRRIGPRSVPQQWFVLIGVVVLLVLLVLLVAVSYRRQQKKNKSSTKGEEFGDSAMRRGLSARERQILLAVALRGGLQHTHEIFHEIEAFNRGAVQLLAECARTRTPQEIDDLKAEITRLRLKLGFQKDSGGRGEVVRGHASSRDIPVGKSLELTGRRDREAIVIRAEVLRSDEIELAVALPTPLESKPGDSWLARYHAGMSAWEFRTSTVSCNGKRLVLNHSEEIHFINRRRFPRVAVRAPALVAHWPFLRGGPAAGEATAVPERDLPHLGSLLQGADGQGAVDASPMAEYVPQFVESTVTELAGPGLRIETLLQVQVDDRVLVVFRLADGIDGTQALPHAVAAAGRVKHGRDIEHGMAIPDAIDRVWDGSQTRDFHALAAGPLSIAVELTGLSNEEIEELASLTNKLFSGAQHSPDREATGPVQTPTYEMTAT